MARTRVVMVPGWHRKIMVAADPEILKLAFNVSRHARRNMVRDDTIRTGALVRSVNARRHTPGVWRVWIGTDHWHFIEYGTRPHIIRAKPGGALAFRVGGRLVITRQVRHPGTREYAPMRTALHQARRLG